MVSRQPGRLAALHQTHRRRCCAATGRLFSLTSCAATQDVISSALQRDEFDLEEQQQTLTSPPHPTPTRVGKLHEGFEQTRRGREMSGAIAKKEGENGVCATTAR